MKENSPWLWHCAVFETLLSETLPAESWRFLLFVFEPAERLKQVEGTKRLFGTVAFSDLVFSYSDMFGFRLGVPGQDNL